MSSDMINKLGEKLRSLRQRQGLSQTQLGDRLGVNQTYVGKMERGEKIPNLEMFLKISDLFKVSTDQLIRDELELE